MVGGVCIRHNYQTQFGRVIRTESFEFLLSTMEEQRQAIQ
jgi:hypothetical protein